MVCVKRKWPIEMFHRQFAKIFDKSESNREKRIPVHNSNKKRLKQAYARSNAAFVPTKPACTTSDGKHQMILLSDSPVRFSCSLRRVKSQFVPLILG